MSSVRTNCREAYKTSANSMDFDRAVEEMEWKDVISTLQVAIDELLGNAPNPPPGTPSCPPPVPAGLVGNDGHPQTVESLSGEYGGYFPLGAPPHSFEQPSPLMAPPGVNFGQPSPLIAPPGLNVGQAAPFIYQGTQYDQSVMQSGHLYSQACAYSQGQWPVDDVPRSAAASYPAAPPYPYGSVPAVRHLEGMGQNLPPVGLLNGHPVYGTAGDGFASSYFAIPPLNTSMSNKENQGYEFQPYVKKPPNAFMLFMKEQRPKLMAELKISGSAVVNTILGQRWKLLSNEEKSKYFEEAQKEKQLHSQRHPYWSSKENYGKKRRRKMNVFTPGVQGSASKLREATQRAKKLCVTPMQTAVMEPSPLQRAAMEPSILQRGVTEAPDTQAALMQPPHVQAAATLHVCDFCHLPHVYETYWLDSPTTTASTAMIHPAGLSRCTD